MALNHIVIMGRTTKTPELRRTPNGVAVTTFTLAVDRDFKNQNGEKETDFIDCVAWKGTAEFVANYVIKGRMLAVEGRLQLREYTDKDGNRRKVAEVIASGVFFADSKREDNMGSLPKTFVEVEDNETLPF
jgi:single-strand DNA-binding protein